METLRRIIGTRSRSGCGLCDGNMDLGRVPREPERGLGNHRNCNWDLQTEGRGMARGKAGQKKATRRKRPMTLKTVVTTLPKPTIVSGRPAETAPVRGVKLKTV